MLEHTVGWGQFLFYKEKKDFLYLYTFYLHSSIMVAEDTV